MQRKDSSVMVMTDITEELNAVDMRSFTHRFFFLFFFFTKACSSTSLQFAAINT